MMKLGTAVNGFLGTPDQAWQLGQRLGVVFNDVKGGMAKGEAMRGAKDEAEQLNGREVEVDGPTEWSVDGEKFANHQEAARFAKDTGLSLMDVKRNDTKQTQRFDQGSKKVDAEALYFTKYLPAQVQKLRADGWGTQADQLEDYTNSEVGKQYASNYARMLQAHAAGNFDAAAKHLEKLQELNSERHTAAVKPTGDGGYAVTLTDPESGEKREVELTQDRLTGDMGMFAFMDPAKMVGRMDTAKAAKAKALGELAQEKQQTARALALKGLDFRQDTAKARMQHGYKLDEITTQAQLEGIKPGEIGKKVADLRREFPNLTEDQILSMVKTDGARYGKATHPETTANRLHMLMLEDEQTVFPEYESKKYRDLTPAQQQAVIGRRMAVPRAAADSVIKQQAAGNQVEPSASNPPPLPMW